MMKLTIDQTLKKGVEAHKAGKLQEADHFYTAILKAQPKHSDANHNMGVLAVGIGKVQEALPFFKTALEANPSIAQFWLSYIDALIKLNRVADAKLVLGEAKSKSIKGDSFEQIEQRLIGLEKGIDVKVDSSKSQEPPKEQLQNLINIYTQGLFQKALAQGSELLKDFPNSINLYNIIGAANKDLGKLDKAIEAYNKALSLNPNYAEAYYNMGNALKDQLKLDEAIEAYNKALSIKPDYAQAYNNMGNILQNQGKLDEAVEAYNKAISLKPYYAQAYNNMGNILQNQGKLDEAVEAYNKAISLKPDYAEAYNNLGITLERNGQLEKALEIYEESIYRIPKNILLKMNLERLKSRLVPSWHINMMNDNHRNDAYFEAIKLAVSKNYTVLDIGTGSGLLSMMAADSGAKKIITCESSRNISNIAKKIIADNGYNEIIKVINKKSTDLIVGKDLPEKVDLVISEILSSEFVGEGVQSTILDANNRLMKSTGKMIPESGEIRIALIGESSEVLESVFINKVGKFDLTKFNSISGNKVNVKLKEKPNILSDTEIAFKINLFGCKNITEQEKIIVFTAKKSGMCYGLIQWMRINIYKKVKYENMPGETASHWGTPIYLFDEPVSLKLGEKIKIKASLFNDRVWFCEVL